MPTQSALDIVNAIFAGQRDLSDYVDTGMKLAAFDQIADKKKEIGAKVFAPEPEEEIESEEEPTDETD
jgi:hypothetical protein